MKYLHWIIFNVKLFNVKINLNIPIIGTKKKCICWIERRTNIFEKSDLSSDMYYYLTLEFYNKNLLEFVKTNNISSNVLKIKKYEAIYLVKKF